MTTVKIEKEHDGNMRALAADLEAHYTQPFPAATRRAPNFFPALLDQGILWGMLLGALLGATLAWLVHSGRVTPTGWEGLFAMVPFTFYAFFIFLGAALGLVGGGVATLLVAPVPPLPPAAAEGDDAGGDRPDIHVDTTTHPDAAQRATSP